MTASNSANTTVLTVLGLAVATFSVALIINTVVPSLLGIHTGKAAALDQVKNDINRVCGDATSAGNTLNLNDYRIVRDDSDRREIKVVTTEGNVENQNADTASVECDIENEFSISGGYYEIGPAQNGGVKVVEK